MKVLLIDDHPLILAALQTVIRGIGTDTTVTGAETAEAAREQLRADADFDLVLLDLQLADADGFDLLVEFRAAYPALPVVVLSASERTADVIRVIDAGAMGFVHKRASNATLFEALHLVLSGGIYVPPLSLGGGGSSAMIGADRGSDTVPSVLRSEGAAAAGALAAGIRPATAEDVLREPVRTARPRPLAEFGLTPRQTEVLGLLLKGQANKLIARELGLSVETVKDHVAAVLRALNVSSRTQAVLAVSQMSGTAAGALAWGSRAEPRRPGTASMLSGSASTLAPENIGAAAEARPMAVGNTGLDAGVSARDRAQRSGPDRASPAESDALLRDRVRGMVSYNATSLAGHAIGALVVEAVFRAAPGGLRLGWGLAFAAVWAMRVGLAWRMRGPLPADTGRLGRARDAWVVGILASGALWGGAGWAFYGHGGALEQIALIVVVYTYCVACVPILAPQFGLYLLFVALVELPVIVKVALSPPVPAGAETALVMLIAMAMTTILGRNYRGVFEALARLQRRNLALVAELRAKTAIAEAARGQAEVANRAKTQFFAAASHDLRQPLHAMGLFAEALRRRVREPEVAQLVLSINESVDALEGLFSELLDITRIDSGGVDVRPQAFALGPMLRRIGLHFQPAAFEKGLALRLRDGGHAVHADPLLVERILRNLVSNAIRYTEDGSVLVSVRRRGAAVHLQVWDTGPGIAPDDRQRIFDEFTQLPATSNAMPEQRKGLGLGLAIVRRLAALMEAPLELASTPGRGTVFTLELNAAVAPTPPVATPHALRPPGLATLAGRSIVIVEDEPAVRTGLRLLLTDWGARVDDFDSLPAVRAWAHGADAHPPDLLIVDHRLGDGATGLDAIRLLRERFAADLPAIVVTGSLLTVPEADMQAQSLHVLLKPVVPNKLRALIAFKLGA